MNSTDLDKLLLGHLAYFCLFHFILIYYQVFSMQLQYIFIFSFSNSPLSQNQNMTNFKN